MKALREIGLGRAARFGLMTLAMVPYRLALFPPLRALWLRLLGTSLRDTETGYKFFRRQALLPLLEEVRDPGWFWDTEVMVRAEQRGLRIAEIPGAYVRRFDKTSTVRGLRDSFQYFGKLLAFRRQLGASRR